MARYDSQSTTTDGQYPATAWSLMGLPTQDEMSGAPGGSPTSSAEDGGGTNQPGQYPERDTFTGVALDGTGAPGTQGVPNEAVSGEPNVGGSADTVVYSKTTFYKGMYDDGGMEQGYLQATASDQIGGPADWTQANDYSYGPGYNMPGVEGNTPSGGDGQFQPGAGSVMYGGFLKGQRPATSQHPGSSGPGT